jgi:hypothetical protein
LRNLRRLKKLNISNTDISEGLEYLPNKSTLEIICSSEREESKVVEVERQLKPFGNNLGK